MYVSFHRWVHLDATLLQRERGRVWACFCILQSLITVKHILSGPRLYLDILIILTFHSPSFSWILISSKNDQQNPFWNCLFNKSTCTFILLSLKYFVCLVAFSLRMKCNALQLKHLFDFIKHNEQWIFYIETGVNIFALLTGKAKVFW